MRYRWHTGFVAWLIQRVTGLLLSLYIFLHLYVLSHLTEPDSYENLMELMHKPLFRISEVGLLAVVLLHGINGIRVSLADLGLGSRYQKVAFWTGMFLFMVLFIMGGVPIIWGEI